MNILIAGVGSILRGDDGVGPRIIDELEKMIIPENIRLHSGDISGLDLLKYFPGHDEVIIIDAADMGETPGTFKIFDLADVKKADFKDVLSTHGMALLETLTLAEELDIGRNIRIIAIQPEDVSYNLELSETIRTVIPEVISMVMDIIWQKKEG